ncbi:5'/3'-nucleotidase SurE [Mycobacterium sp. ACS4331]|nr:5'/3'-nucleotidase SurE [Mycobacterium sp. ACS4331]
MPDGPGVPTHVLLTNDDGYDKQGLQALRTALIAAGFRVTVMAPAANRSCIGRGVTCHDPVEVRLHDDDGRGNRIYSCSGTPVDCVRVALLSDVIDRVDVVASGINHGVNMGDDATFSGTVGAALEGALLGIPSVAFSQQDDAGDVSMVSHGSHHFLATELAVRATGLLVENPPPPGIIASINFPHGVKDPVVAKARLSSFTYQRHWTPAERISDDSWNVWAYAKPGQPDPDVNTSAGTDYATVIGRAASVSAVRADWDGLSDAPVGVNAWLDGFVAGLGAGD